MTIKHKMKNRKGFTLAETLLAVLILLLVSTIVAQGVPVARNVYQKVVLSANAQDMLATAVSALRDELGTGWDVQVDTTAKTITYYSADTGARSKLSLSTTAPTQIMLQKNVGVLELGIVDNAKSSAEPLVSDGGATDTSKLFVSYSDVAYDATNHKVTFTGLAAGTVAAPELAKLDTMTIDVFMDKKSSSGD